MIPKFGSLEYYEDEMNNKKLILDAIQRQIKNTISNPNFQPTAKELYRFYTLLAWAEEEYSDADKQYETINDELNEQKESDEEKRRNEDY